MLTVNRYHDISVGHRVMGHEGKCKNLHGHNYRIHFKAAVYVMEASCKNSLCEACEAVKTYPNTLDAVGRVIDFGVIKERLCMWLEDNWDHKLLLNVKDEALAEALYALKEPVVLVPFNPTAEEMALFLLNVVCPAQLAGTNVEVVGIIIEETRKCSVEISATALQ